MRDGARSSLEREFLITATLTVGLSMATLGYWVEKRIRSGWVQGMAETGAALSGGLSAHHVQLLETSRSLPARKPGRDRALAVQHQALVIASPSSKIRDTSMEILGVQHEQIGSHGKLHAGYLEQHQIRTGRRRFRYGWPRRQS